MGVDVQVVRICMFGGELLGVLFMSNADFSKGWFFFQASERPVFQKNFTVSLAVLSMPLWPSDHYLGALSAMVLVEVGRWRAGKPVVGEALFRLSHGVADDPHQPVANTSFEHGRSCHGLLDTCCDPVALRHQTVSV